MIRVFRSVFLAFMGFWLLPAPVSTAATEFPLGPGDLLEIRVYGQPDLSIETRVSASGAIRFPLLGRVEVAGKPAPEVEELIGGRLEEGGFLRDAHVNVLITEHRSSTVAVLGAVNAPGKLALDRAVSLTEALAMAGGISEGGSERIVVIRADAGGRQLRREFNLRELLDSRADGHEVVALRGGDALYVPRADQFYVYGEVNQPGVYPLDRPLNVMQALSISGGFSPRASHRRITLYRKQPDGTVEEVRAELSDPIRDGDVLFIRESLF